MPAPYPETVKDQLALWLAAGGSLRCWCRRNAIPPQTASTWSRTEAFRRRVEAHRRRATARAIGRMARHFGQAVATAGRLVGGGTDDRVKLAAALSLIDQMIQIGGRAELSARIRRLDERLAARGDGG